MTVFVIFLILHGAATLLASGHIILYKREPAAAVMWLFMVATLPGLGITCYLIFGVNFHNRRLNRKIRSTFLVRQLLASQAWRKARAGHRAADVLHPVLTHCRVILDAMAQRAPVEGNAVEMLIGGAQTYRALFSAIRAATDHIHIQVYILASDELGRDLLSVLAERASHGVEVRVLYDSIGSSGISRRYLRDLSDAGIYAEAFGRLNPIRRGFQINFRNHRKNTIIDGRIAFTGGINLHAENSRRYCRQPRELHERLIRDYHFRVEGPVVGHLQEVFAEDWHFVTGQMLVDDRYYPPTASIGQAVCRVVTSGPGDDAQVIARTLFAAITAAQNEILIVSPYFFPDPAILVALQNAARSGIRVHVIVPVQSDHHVVTWAGRSLFLSLVESGVRVHLRRLPFIHSKAILVDRAWALVGSTNLDYRSLRLNFELNLEVVDSEFARELGETLDGEMRASSPVQRGELARAGSLRRFRDNFCALFAPIL